MVIDDQPTSEAQSPLEEFLRDYADVTGGMWDEVEPQVYDLMLPPSSPSAEPEVVRVAFDPEAIPEHPGAQLASYGTPLVNQLLSDAITRGRHVELYHVGANLAPQGLEGRVRRALTLPSTLTLKVDRIRPLHFPQAAYWFEATFVSDQKEQELLTTAVDLHYGRQVRHLETLLDRTHLAEVPWSPLPEVRHGGLASSYPIARDRVVRTLAALANTRSRELRERTDRQVERMARYYADLRSEVDEQATRAKARGEDLAKFDGRRETLHREEQIRCDELRRKSRLEVRLRLISLLVIHQPKLLVRCTLTSAAPSPSSNPIECVWDPLLDALEAIPCPTCHHPTFALDVNRQGKLICPSCSGKTPPATKAGRR